MTKPDRLLTLPLPGLRTRAFETFESAGVHGFGSAATGHWPALRRSTMWCRHCFAPGQLEQVAWVPDESNRDFLGNEFLLWLWYYLENVSDAIAVTGRF